MFRYFSLVVRFYSLLFLLFFTFTSFAQSQKNAFLKVSERSSKEQYALRKNSKDVDILVKQLMETQHKFADRIEFYRQKSIDLHFSSSCYGKFFGSCKSFLVASEDKFRKISVDYPVFMKTLIADAKKFDKKFLSEKSIQFINNVLVRQQAFKKRYKLLDKKTQLTLNIMARKFPNQMFPDFLAFLNYDQLKLRELCLSHKKEIIHFQAKISEKIF